MASVSESHWEIYPFLDQAKFKGTHDGKVVVVTGAARGIGQQIAQHFASAGASTLVVLDLKDETLQETVELCQREGSEVMSAGCDVSNEDNVKAILQLVIEKFSVIDILVNCAGICSSKPLFLDSFPSMWKDISVNLGGPLITMATALPHMKAAGHGVIINIASRAGTVTVPFLASYSISKCALIKATECFQKDIDVDGLGDKIQIYACHPGAVQTDLSRRPMDPEVAKKYPELAANRPKWVENFKTQPSLCAATCVFLATGAVKETLKGRYIDCEHDVQVYLDPRNASEIVERELHTLRVGMGGGLQNDGGGAKIFTKID